MLCANGMQLVHIELIISLRLIRQDMEANTYDCRCQTLRIPDYPTGFTIGKCFEICLLKKQTHNVCHENIWVYKRRRELIVAWVWIVDLLHFDLNATEE
jgi:hypothetical protein